MRFDLYGPQALQYTHVILFGQDAWTVPIDRSVRAQVDTLTAESGESDNLLGL